MGENAQPEDARLTSIFVHGSLLRLLYSFMSIRSAMPMSCGRSQAPIFRWLFVGAVVRRVQGERSGWVAGGGEARVELVVGGRRERVVLCEQGELENARVSEGRGQR